MPFQQIRLVGPSTLTTSSSLVYTVPSSRTTVIKQVVVTNITASAATFTLNIGASNSLFNAVSVAANDTMLINLSQVLTAGETLYASASANSALNLTISGVVNDGPIEPTETYIADGSVTSAKIADGTIVNADINASAGIDATKISGTALTASTVDAKGDLLVGTADNSVSRLAVGSNNFLLTADSSTASGLKWGTAPLVCTFGTRPSSPFEGLMIYETDTDMLAIWNGSSWRYIAATTPSSGTVLQVQSSNKTDTAAISTSAYTDVGLSVAITPKSTTSKVFVMAFLNLGASFNSNGVYAQLVRNSTAIALGDAAGSRRRVSAAAEGNQNSMTQATITIMDEPATTSAVTYKVQISNNGSGFALLNRSLTDDNADGRPRGFSSITAMEIAG